MKILIIHNNYQQAGGESVAVDAHISLLRQHDQSVSLYLKDNSEINRYNLIQKISFFPRTIYSRKTYQEIRSLVKENQPDIAHVHNVFPLISPAVYRALHDAGIPTVQTLHNFRFLCPNGLFYINGHICELCKYGNTFHAVAYKCYRSSYPLSLIYAASIGLHRRLRTFQKIDHFIGLTEFTSNKMIESGLVPVKKVSILGNFLPDINLKIQGEKPETPYIVYLGRLSPEKGVDTLIRAMADMSSLELKIAGDGPQAGELKDLANRLGLSNVTFLGLVSGRTKWDLLQNALASSIPSLCYENLPYAALESMAAGTPILASNIGSLPYIIKDSYTGLLFEPGNPVDLHQKISWLSTHQEDVKRMGKNCRVYFEESYNSEVHFARLMQIYNDVIERKRRNNGG